MDEDLTVDPENRLLSIEKVWRTRYEWLRQSGYLLRRRYEPDWIPSWKDSEKPPYLCEDGVEVRVCQPADVYSGIYTHFHHSMAP